VISREKLLRKEFAVGQYSKIGLRQQERRTRRRSQLCDGLNRI